MKLFDLAADQLRRYLGVEKRALTGAIENLWDKYAVPNRLLESSRLESVQALRDFLVALGYVQ
jgi:hypothetical protein